LLGPSFYLRRRIGTRRWRTLHRATAVVWVLGAIHALGSGTDANRLWLRAIVLLPAVPIAYLVTVRALGGARAAPTSRSADRVGPHRSAGALAQSRRVAG
jgi:sulfoxide reductase heme-binding subunit YedZ